MPGKKSIKTKGKLQLSRYFQTFVAGDKVSVVKEQSIPSSFPTKLQGRTGTVEEKRGKVYIVKIKDSDKEKRYLIEPIHLKRIKMIAHKQ